MPTKTCEIDLIVHSVKTKIKLLGTKTTEPHSSEAPVAEDHKMRRATFVGKANWASFFQNFFFCRQIKEVAF